MKFALAKLLHVIVFLLFSSVYLWIMYQSWGDTWVSRFSAMGMVTLIVFQAKWCFIDGFKAVNRRRILEQDGELTAL